MLKQFIKRLGASFLAGVMTLSAGLVAPMTAHADSGFTFREESGAVHMWSASPPTGLKSRIGADTAGYKADMTGIASSNLFGTVVEDGVQRMYLSGLSGYTFCVNPIINVSKNGYRNNFVLEASKLDGSNIDAFTNKYASVYYPNSFKLGKITSSTPLKYGMTYGAFRQTLSENAKTLLISALLFNADSETQNQIYDVVGMRPPLPIDVNYLQFVGWYTSVDNMLATYKYGSPMSGSLYTKYSGHWAEMSTLANKVYDAIKGGKIRLLNPKVVVSQNTAAGSTNAPGMNSVSQVLHTISGKFEVNGKLTLIKISEKPEYTKGNSAYDMTGAKYGVFSDSGCSNQVGTLTVQSNDGKTDTISLAPGNYWVKEIGPAKLGHSLNSNSRAVTVAAGKETKETLDGNMLEPCLTDPFFVVVQKGIEGAEKAGQLMGDIPTLKGIKFRVNYYNDLYDSVGEAKKHTPSVSAVFETDEDGFLPFAEATPVNGVWPYHNLDGENIVPLGTVVMEEVSALDGLHVSGNKAFQVIDSGNHTTAKSILLEKWSELPNANGVGTIQDGIWKGGVKIVKADNELNKSVPQGDASIEYAKVDIINRSLHPVNVDGKIYKVGEVVKTLKMKWNEKDKTYEDGTSNHILPYGTYELREQDPSGAIGYHTGYNDGKGWSRTFSIRRDGEMHQYDLSTGDKSVIMEEDITHYGWMKNQVQRGGVIVGKIDREIRQYMPLGEAELTGSTFEIVNKSKRSVVVDGKEYQVGEVVKTIATENMKWKNEDIVAAYTGDDSLPYGTYEIHEKSSGRGYLFDKESKKWSKTFKIRKQGQVIDFTDTKDAVANQVIREDFHFTKKQGDGASERMANVAWLVTSKTTGEKHIIVTDENGGFDSEAFDHSDKTNANDPVGPNSNEAVAVDESGNWYVKDAKKLNPEAGVWFTGVAPEKTKWVDGVSYEVNGKTTAKVNDSLRAFPYDKYSIEELRCPANEGFGLINVNITLHRYTKDHDGKGLNYDYGTLDDKAMGMGTELTFGLNGKVAPAAKDTTVSDAIDFWGLPQGKSYTAKGELHLVNADGKDEGVVAEATSKFNTGRGEGTANVEFVVDTTDMGGKKLVAFESILDESGKEVTTHKDIEDKDQTVMIPKIGTTLMGDIEHEALASEDITLVDTIKYTNLEVGKKYTAVGTLHVKDSKGADAGELKDEKGNVVTSVSEFVPTKTSGEVKVEFKFNGVNVAGKNVVAFESVKQGDIEFAVHADIDDKGQTVHFPEVKTEAKDKVDGDHEAYAGEKQTVVDTVEMHNLTVGKKYKLNGNLHIQNVDAEGNITDGGILKDKDGKVVVAEKEFTADKSDMTVALEFTFDASELAGKTVVAFETLSRDGKIIGLHADITDESQSVSFPKIGTNLTDVNGSHDVSITEPAVKAGDKTDVEKKDDKVTDKSNKKDDKSDKKDESDKKIDVIGNTILAGFNDAFGFKAHAEETKVVDTKAKDKTADKDDKAEDAKADEAESKITSSVTDGTKVTIIDHVGYENLIPGTEYTINGKLHLKNVDKDGKIVDGGVLKDASGKEVTGTTTFKPDKANGTVEVKFEFDAAGLAGKSVVAFEDIMKGKQLVATHSDINDENQTVRIVKIGTTALDAENKTHTLTDSIGETQKVSVVDTVAYTNLKVGQAYTVEGKLHIQKVDKDGKITDGGVVKDKDGKEVTSTASFTPEKSDGTVDVKFEFEVAAGTLDGTTLVAFEDVKNGDNIIATHADITDEAQSVHKLKVGTTLTGADKKGKDVQIGDKIDLIDTVAFENLVVGQEYVVKGKLVDASGKALKDKNGKEVVAESRFTPDKAIGTAEMKFTVDTSAMKDGDKIVAYEYVYTTDGKLVGHHEDLKDANQTVTVKKDSTTPKEHVDLNTGVDNFGLIAAIVMGILALTAAATYVYRRRKGQANA